MLALNVTLYVAERGAFFLAAAGEAATRAPRHARAVIAGAGERMPRTYGSPPAATSGISLAPRLAGALARLVALQAAALLLRGRGRAVGQLDVLVGARDAGLELAPALDLGVQLGAEQDREVRDPQPDEEHDDAGQRAVGLVVGREPGHVEREQRRRDDPHHDGQDAARRDPGELVLLRVGRGVVQ